MSESCWSIEDLKLALHAAFTQFARSRASSLVLAMCQRARDYLRWNENKTEKKREKRRRNIKYHDRTFTRASAHCSDGILKTHERNKEKKCIENLNVRKKEKTKRVRTKLNFLSWAVGNENWFCLICVVAHTSTSTCTLSNLIKTASSSNENEKSSQIEHFSLHV